MEEALKKAVGNPSDLAAKPSDPEDSDSWLEVSPDDLDAMLLRASGGKQHQAEDADEARKQEDNSDAQADHPLKELAKKVEAFVGGQGDLEGARFAE